MKFLFVANYCDYDRELANRLADQVTRLGYPIILIPDEGLKLLDISAWCRRYLSVARGLAADYLIKVDPDAYVKDWLRLDEIPDADVFGSLTNFRGGRFPLGGAFGMRTAAAMKMYGMLADRHIAQIVRPYKRTDAMGQLTYICPIEEDALSIVATRGGLTVANWEAVNIKYRPYQSSSQAYSIIHPVGLDS